MLLTLCDYARCFPPLEHCKARRIVLPLSQPRTNSAIELEKKVCWKYKRYTNTGLLGGASQEEKINIF